MKALRGPQPERRRAGGEADRRQAGGVQPALPARDRRAREHGRHRRRTARRGTASDRCPAARHRRRERAETDDGDDEKKKTRTTERPTEAQAEAEGGAEEAPSPRRLRSRRRPRPPRRPLPRRPGAEDDARPRPPRRGGPPEDAAEEAEPRTIFPGRSGAGWSGRGGLMRLGRSSPRGAPGRARSSAAAPMRSPEGATASRGAPRRASRVPAHHPPSATQSGQGPSGHRRLRQWRQDDHRADRLRPPPSRLTRRSCAARAPCTPTTRRNEAGEGDVVRVVETRPLSRRPSAGAWSKSWRRRGSAS